MTDVATPPQDGPSQEDRERVRAYLLAQAERYQPVDYWPRLMEQRLRLLQLLEEMTPEQAAWRPSAEPSANTDDEATWNAIEIAQHVRVWSDHVVDLTRAFVAGGEPRVILTGYTEIDPDASIVGARRALTEATQRLGESLVHDAAAADSTRTVLHNWFGPLTARQWFVMARVHDIDHIRQIEAMQQLPDYPASASDR